MFQDLRRTIGAERSLLAKLDADLKELRHRRRRVKSIGIWYREPCAGARALVFVTIRRHRPSWDRDPVVPGGFVAFFAACPGLAWFINNHARRTQLALRIAELEKLRAAILDEI